MKMPLSLIRSYLPSLTLSPKEVADVLTLAGVEVDHLLHPTAPFSGVYVGEVVSVLPHPNAERLRVAEVSDGKETVSVVCGAPNCRAGIKTAFAKPGALLTDAQGEKQKISRAKLRGIESNGMLCSEEELSLGKASDGIVELPHEFQTGADLAPLLWDPLFEISLTPDLGHCLSALGLARLIASVEHVSLSLPKFPSLKKNRDGKEKEWKLEIQAPDLCPLYFGALMEDVKIGPSPFWLRKVLTAAGIRPICNAVDIGNYILLKRGQPLHLFDADALQGNTLFVKRAEKESVFRGLDEIERTIPEGTLLISDQKGPVAIAGILGGERSSTGEKTKRLFIESALFSPSSIRKTMKKLDLRTESGHRFERGIDPEGIESALQEAAALIAEICGGKAVEETAYQSPGFSFAPKKIPLRLAQIPRLLGLPLSQGETEGILRRLHFPFQEATLGTLEVTVPLYRHDVSKEIDLLEEIARLYGYHRFPAGNLCSSLSSLPHDPVWLWEERVRKGCLGLGLQEFLTADLIGPQLISLAKEWLHPNLHLLQTINSKTEHYSLLRPSLLPGLLEVVRHNGNQKRRDIAAFEIGNIHLMEKEAPFERAMLALVLTGKRAPSHWSDSEKKSSNAWDFFDLKGMIESLLPTSLADRSLKAGKKSLASRYEHSSHPSFHPHAQAHLFIGDDRIGSLGQLHPELTTAMQIEEKVFYAEIDLQSWRDALNSLESRMQPLPKFPNSERDWTLPWPRRKAIQPLLDAVYAHASPLLEDVHLLDLYAPAEKEEKMVTLRFLYRDSLKTLSFDEVQKEHDRLVTEVLKTVAN
ncbi:MAG: phenylalanine--tRNA ligase subunit beta [Verrucomicrobiota bacterium]|nr:phenylalanine--tRNA ligase subunit beta [Verrucomicrobiota bacterium]